MALFESRKAVGIEQLLSRTFSMQSPHIFDTTTLAPRVRLPNLTRWLRERCFSLSMTAIQFDFSTNSKWNAPGSSVGKNENAPKLGA